MPTIGVSRRKLEGRLQQGLFFLPFLPIPKGPEPYELRYPVECRPGLPERNTPLRDGSGRVVAFLSWQAAIGWINANGYRGASVAPISGQKFMQLDAVVMV